MIKGTTPTGFEYHVDKETLNDYELLEEVSAVDDNPLLIANLVKRLLGKEQTNKLKEHIRSDAGIVPLDVMTNEIVAIFQSTKEIKN